MFGSSSVVLRELFERLFRSLTGFFRVFRSFFLKSFLEFFQVFRSFRSFAEFFGVFGFFRVVQSFSEFFGSVQEVFESSSGVFRSFQSFAVCSPQFFQSCSFFPFVKAFMFAGFQ